MLANFYGTLAGVSFALLGLWWVVTQFRHEQEGWLHDRRRRRVSYDVTLYFLLPGVMSMTALISEDSDWLWRAGFVVAAVIGALEAVAMAGSAAGDNEPAWLRGAFAGAAALYALIALVALAPRLARDLGLDLRGIEVEALLATLLIVLGVNYAWLVFAGPFRRGPSDD